jgi:ankyrin repeat protein
MFLIYDDLCSNIEIKCKYNNIIDKIFILKFINKINDLFIWLSRNRYYKIIKSSSIYKRVNPSNSNRAIQWASRNGHLEIVKLLLKDKRVDPGDNNNYAIKWAFTNKYYKVVKLLLKDERVDPNNNNKKYNK